MAAGGFSAAGFKNTGVGYIEFMSEHRSDELVRIYLSASISNAHNNAYLAEHFAADAFEFYLPQRIVPDQLNHERFPLDAFQQCLEMMSASHFGLVLFDAFGRDCAWECGWYAGRPDKALFGFVESSSVFMRDWMVKGGLDGLVTTNPRMFAVFQENPILQGKPLRLIQSSAELPQALLDLWQTWQARAQ